MTLANQLALRNPKDHHLFLNLVEFVQRLLLADAVSTRVAVSGSLAFGTSPAAQQLAVSSSILSGVSLIAVITECLYLFGVDCVQAWFQSWLLVYSRTLLALVEKQPFVSGVYKLTTILFRYAELAEVFRRLSRPTEDAEQDPRTAPPKSSRLSPEDVSQLREMFQTCVVSVARRLPTLSSAGDLHWSALQVCLALPISVLAPGVRPEFLLLEKAEKLAESVQAGEEVVLVDSDLLIDPGRREEQSGLESGLGRAAVAAAFSALQQSIRLGQPGSLAGFGLLVTDVSFLLLLSVLDFLFPPQV